MATVILLGALNLHAQESGKDLHAPPPRITFSTIPTHQEESLKSHYEALKYAEFGNQRFSIFEQLMEEHITRGNTDSILHYGNLYVKELGNWQKPDSLKTFHYAKAHYFLGIGNHFNGLLDKSIEWHIKGLQDAEATNSTEFQYRNKIGLSHNYILKSETDKALVVLTKAVLNYGTEFPKLTIQAHLLMGNAHLFKQEYDLARTDYEEALRMALDFKDAEKELSAKLNLAKLAEAQQDYEKAFQGYESVRNQALARDFTAIYFEGSLLLAKLYYKEEMYKTANIALSFAYINAIDRENLQFQKEALMIQARSFAKLDDYKNAYAVMTQLSGVNHQINTKQQREIIKELEIQYETLEKEKAISSLEEDQLIKAAELKRQKTVQKAFLIGFLVILIPIIALLYVYYQKIQTQSELNKKQEIINQQKVTTLKQEQELNLIKASIDGQDEERKRIAQELHDSIGGNLAGIKLQVASMTSESDRWKDINGQLDETYQLVRDISHTLIPKKFRQNAFSDLIREYIASISRSGTLKIGFHPHPEVDINAIDDTVQMELFKMIQELMTNTLKHAEASKVDLHLSLLNHELSLLFEDNGKGFDTTATNHGIGFENIQSRITQLNGTLHIDSTPNRGTVIAIEIPIKKISHEI
ncbi:tetratricopeptide repeat-containing sensor histidine kinase [Zobellia alginiliquefaciens]|uniref:tetratricopeptide repeat-containing sensor histidine kinase n=1 Tax=Zobellia alginiliquefaciens TaxID=3032586 RepID=UPI0023E1037F|nr:ATP-binding protein [Zobellia alginiliquefaciens]